VRHGLPGLLKNLGVTSLLDAPCGDGSWIQMLDWNIRYVGVDIVPALIESLRCQAGKGTFLLCDITKDPLPRADAVLCRDCFVHLSFDNINRAVRNFVASGADWLITTTFPEWRENVDCEDGDWRALNLELPPFGWGPPFYVLNERCNEGAGGWSDKSLAFWSLADLG
jgi:SAM-dependent methyltransferase